MNFDRLAPWYRPMETLLAGGVLHRARREWLDRVRDCGRVLIPGDGPGRGVEAVLAASPGARITVVEASGEMIATARRRLAHRGVDTGRVRWIHADLRGWPGPHNSEVFDAVLTQFFLDCFLPADIEAVVSRLAGLLRRGGPWLHCDFRVPARGWRRGRARMIHGMMYRFFRYTTALEAQSWCDPQPVLIRAGLALRGRRTYNAGLVHSDWWERVEGGPTGPGRRA